MSTYPNAAYGYDGQQVDGQLAQDFQNKSHISSPGADGSNSRALAMLDQHIAGDQYRPAAMYVPAMQTPSLADAEANRQVAIQRHKEAKAAKTKSTLDEELEKEAGQRALSKLDQLVAGEKYKPAPGTMHLSSADAEANRLAAIQRHKEAKKNEDIRKSRLDKAREKSAADEALGKLDQLISGDRHRPVTTKKISSSDAEANRLAAIQKFKEAKATNATAPNPNLVGKARLEAKAEGRKHVVTAEDVRDPETVAGMRCQMDVDREKAAQAKALKLASAREFAGINIV
jgi:hypothetical protein